MVYAKEEKTPAPVVKSDEQQSKFANLCEEFPLLRDCLEQQMEKRKSAYMRFGRSSPDVDSYTDDNEDNSGLLDMEKRKSAYMRFGKRFFPANAHGFNDDSSQEVEKRKSAYMRFGKRKSAYMRFGKRSNDETGEVEKRKSAYMRFGRR
uniref:Uncharacterized protein n=1 Tax=Acrobeloides nanus TaxID=290746 RepID=A0A914EA79_9BILA